MSRELRLRIAAEAARLMLEEGFDEYYDAKHQAADNLGGQRGGRLVLPGNREIRAALVARVAVTEGARVERRLVALRLAALTLMDTLAAFSPRLIGSVVSGAVHPGSDIDLQLFTADHAGLEQALWQAGHDAERLEKDVLRTEGMVTYVHYHFEAQGLPVELSVYGPEELGLEQLSSIDGRPIERMPAGRLRAVIQQKHRDAWAALQATAVAG